MADADEAAFAPAGSSGEEQGDLDDETQDFRFLAQLSGTGSRALPRRGEKDFEPHGSQSQADALNAAQAAMRAALSQPCVHSAKSHAVGVLLGAATETPVYDSATDGAGIVRVLNPRGTHFRTLGRADASGTMYLSAEEALYLLERGSLELRWRVAVRGEDLAAGEALQTEEISLSLQSAYALLIGRGVSAEEYSVYTGLKRSGYIVMRAPSRGIAEVETEVRPSGSERRGEGRESETRAAAAQSAWLPAKLMSRLWYGAQSSRTGPLVRPGLYRSYDDIFRQLALVPAHDPSAPRPLPAEHHDTQPPAPHYPLPNEPQDLRCSFWVWKPRPGFKKSTPGPPDWRVAVLDARDTDFLTLENLDTLFGQTPLNPPPERMKTQMYQRLKHGWRNVLLAVVDSGVVSYIRVADAGFGGEKLYHSFGKKPPPKKGNKPAK